MDHPNMTMSAEKMERAVHTKAVVNSFGDGTANVGHEPIPEISWPAMTMELTVPSDVKMMGEVADGGYRHPHADQVRRRLVCNWRDHA